jgi:hypothetical protein
VSSASDEHIAELDRALLLDGEDIVIRRLFGTQLIPLNVECRAFVRNVGNQELIAGIAQENSNVIMSPSQIIASGWPGPWTPRQMRRSSRILIAEYLVRGINA